MDDDEVEEDHSSIVSKYSSLINNVKTLSKTKVDESILLVNELEQLREMLTCLKPLVVYAADIKQKELNVFTPLVDVLDKATCIIYLLLVGISYEEKVLVVKDQLSELLLETDVRKIYLESLRIKLRYCGESAYSYPSENEFYLLDNLISLLQSNSNCFDDGTVKLLKELQLLKTFLTVIPKNVRLRRLSYFESSIEAVCSYAIPVLYSFYNENVGERITSEVDGHLAIVLDLIKNTKPEAKSIELRYYPKTDGLSFLECLKGYLEELLARQCAAIESLYRLVEILQLELNLLLCFFRITKEKLSDAMWTRILHLAYKVEYLIDSYMVRATDSSSIILSLSEIVKQVKRIKAEVMSEYLVGCHEELDVILVPFREKITLAMRLYNDPLIVHQFELRVWCTLSPNCERRELLLKVLSAVGSKRHNIHELNDEELIDKVCIHLKQHRYLIVLDGVCDVNIWNYLRRSFPDDENGSRVIIITTLQPSDFIPASQGHALRRKTRLSHVFMEPPTHVSRTDTPVGFEIESLTVMKYLVGGELERDTISIVGMPGIGKTTLALSVYNDSPVSHFDVRAWCTVSQSYQMRKLLFKILNHINQPLNDVEELDDEDIADQLSKSLRKKRYLIVLDDVWDIKVWNDLKRYLPDDKNLSRILITTRYQTLASETGGKIHALQELGELESWELFQMKLLQKEGFSEELLHIGKEITKSCNGLPLSIVMVAGLLSKLEKNKQTWKEFAESVNSHVLTCNQSNCMAVLDISFNHLPDQLKSCFLYLGAFPLGQDIPVTKLKLLWIGEGFVRDTEKKNSEEIAEESLMELIARSLVIPNKERSLGGVKTCRIHDLLHDFCLKKAEDEHFLRALNSKHHSIRIDDPRRVTIINSCLADFNKLSCHSLRSLFFFNRANAKEIDERVKLNDLVLLRVLDGVMDNMLYCTSGLIHLRYLAVQGTLGIYSIPSSIRLLHNLQILIIVSDLVSPEEAMEVPNSIWGMTKLRHLHIRPRASFPFDRRKPEDSVSLENLRRLSKICLSWGDEGMLKKMPNLQELSCIFFDSWVASLNCYKFPQLDFLSQLTTLKLQYEGYAKDYDERKRCQLHLPINLKKLTLSGFRLLSEDMSKIGQLPCLEVLKLYDSGELFATWSVKDEEFQMLKHLKLRDLLFYRWAASDDCFPCLKQLLIDGCDYLEDIPNMFGDIPDLFRIEIRNCKPSVDDSARIIGKLQREENLNDVLKVFIYPRRIQGDEMLHMESGVQTNPRLVENAKPVDDCSNPLFSVPKRNKSELS